MNEFKNNFLIESSSERSFGFTFVFIFLIISLFPLYFDKNINFLFLSLSIIFFLITIFFKKLLILPNKLWFKFGMILGHLISQIVMLSIFIIFFIPMGFIIMLFKKDLINSKLNFKKNSYWLSRKDNLNSMKNQF